MAGNSVVVIDSATQTSDVESDNEDPYDVPNSSPRVVIDTSQPFESVEEAVIRFGGRGFWIPGSVLAVDAAAAAIDDDQNGPDESDITKLEKRAATMLKELQSKDRETREILQELDLTKRLLEELKLKQPKESFHIECKPIPFLGFDKDAVKKDSVDCNNDREPTELIMNELKQAKLNLYQNTNELASIRACVESLSKKIDNEKSSVQKGGNEVKTIGRSSVNPLAISRELRELNFEADQFMKTAEAAKSEVLRAMSEIDQTKTGLKVIELRWLTAKKLEEAARAAESLALAEIRALSSNERISLSLEEYSALTEKTRQVESVFKRNDTGALRNMQDSREGTQLNVRNSISTQNRRDPRLLDSNEFEFVRNECRSKNRPTTSIGDILRRKLVMKDDLEVGRREESRERVSLNQMLRRHRGETISPQRRREKDGDESKGLFSKRKGLGLVHISFPLSKHGKNKIQALNLW